MALGVVGEKCGMTRIFTEDGASVPVTVIRVEANRVTQLKSNAVDGYSAVQVTTGEQKSSRVNKPLAGHFSKQELAAGRGLWEFRVNDDELEKFSLGSEYGLEIFKSGQYVDVQGVSIGKGFAGGVKRHHFQTQDMTHGNSLSHRAAGSIGQCQTPGRVFKGKKMAGHMGSVKRTMQSLEIINIDQARNLIMIKGSVPGSKGGSVILASAVKK